MPKQVKMWQCNLTGKLFKTAGEAKFSEERFHVLNQRIDSGEYWEPAVGDLVYVATHLYIDHGEDDVVGGWAEVVSVKTEHDRVIINTAEHAGISYTWRYLQQKQAQLRKEFKTNQAYPDPDFG